MTENLRKLERDGYVHRTVDGGPPISVTYGLTDMGRELVSLYKPLVFWAADRFADVSTSRAQYDEG